MGFDDSLPSLINRNCLVWCNQSGGSAFGSLNTGVEISNIVYQNIYTNGGNQAMMFKSNGGSGYVNNVLLQNFISRGTAYGLYINEFWSSISTNPGNGVQLTNITFKVSLGRSVETSISACRSRSRTLIHRY